ncbi:hypothetical protein H9P43_008698 [Blastocladiella emersonii ATCC 22665]|nr:hypothetical protein H9P43_008698 [Blastocladiella emersonii ATCC 22665]
MPDATHYAAQGPLSGLHTYPNLALLVSLPPPSPSDDASQILLELCNQSHKIFYVVLRGQQQEDAPSLVLAEFIFNPLINGKLVELGALACARADFPLRLEWRHAHLLSDVGGGGAHVIDDEDPAGFCEIGLRDEVSDAIWLREFYGLQSRALLPTAAAATATATAMSGPEMATASSPKLRHKFKGLIFTQNYGNRARPVVAKPHEPARRQPDKKERKLMMAALGTAAATSPAV